jgi:hypothetical protein
MTRETDTDKQLWRRAAEARGPSAPASEADLLLLAAYLDGTLGESEHEAFEARLAAEPELLESVVAARAALAEEPGEAPAGVVARAQAIVGSAGRAEAPSGNSFFGGWLQPLAWAAVGVLALIVTGAGFEIGRESYDAVVEMRTVMSETLAFDFPDPASDLIL